MICQRNHRYDVAFENLPHDQGGDGRHKCAGCAYEKGFEITGLEEAAAPGAVVFHAGTAFKDGKVVNIGGRVLGVTARGRTIREAIQNAYAAVAKIHWKGCFYRKDIGHRALARECNPGKSS